MWIKISGDIGGDLFTSSQIYLGKKGTVRHKKWNQIASQSFSREIFQV